MCHPLGMSDPGERLGFNLVHKKCSSQNYKRGGGSGWVQSWVGGSCPKYPPPPLINEAWQEYVSRFRDKEKFSAVTLDDLAPVAD